MALIFIADGFEEIEALTVVDLLRRAEMSIRMVSIGTGLEVEGAHGIKVLCDVMEKEAEFEEELIILPGGGKGTSNLDKDLFLHEKLKQHVDKGRWLAAICAAPSVLGHIGILEGKKATCYPGVEAELNGAIVKNDTVVVDGNIITSRGPATSIPFALKIIEKLRGVEAAREIAKDILYS